MVTTTEASRYIVSERAESALHALAANVADLPGIAAEWYSLSEAERISWSLDWDHLMATYLRMLDRSALLGELTPDQQTRYRDLLSKLKRLLPTIARLNLFPPSVALDV